MSLLKRLRFAADLSTETLGENLLTSAQAHLLKPSACQFEVTLLANSAALQSVVDLDQLTLSVKLNDPRTGLALMQKTVASGALNLLLTWDDFQTGEAANCHAVFTFTAAETNLDLTATEQDFYLVLEGIDADGNEVAFCDGKITIEESGAFADAPASVTPDLYYTQAQSDSRYLLAADLTAKVNRTGDTMLGALTLSGAPTVDLHAATKKYVDDADALKQDAITGAASTVASSNLTASRAVVSNSSGKIAVASVTSTELGYVSGVTSAIQTQLDSKGVAITGAASTVVSSNLTTSRAVVSDGSGKIAVSAVTSTELGYVSGVTSAVQTQLDAKGEVITGAASTVVSADLTAERAVVSDVSGKLGISAVTSAELLFLAGCTDVVQDQLDAKLALSGGTLTGALTLSGAPTTSLHAATKAYVDTADALKLALAGGTMSGALQFSGSGHAGLRLNNLTNLNIAALTPNIGDLVYNTTEARVQVYESGGWTNLSTTGGGGGGTVWHHDNVDPTTEGSDGDYFLNETDGSIWFKASGTWSKIVAARLPLTGGDITGGLTISDTLDVTSYATFHNTVNIDSGDLALASGNVDIVGVYKVSGTQVVGAQQAAISTLISGSVPIDTAVNGILSALRAHGLIAT